MFPATPRPEPSSLARRPVYTRPFTISMISRLRRGCGRRRRRLRRMPRPRAPARAMRHMPDVRARDRLTARFTARSILARPVTAITHHVHTCHHATCSGARGGCPARSRHRPLGRHAAGHRQRHRIRHLPDDRHHGAGAAVHDAGVDGLGWPAVCSPWQAVSPTPRWDRCSRDRAASTCS